MKLSEIDVFITEKRTESSWLFDLSYNRKKHYIKMHVSTDKQNATYYIHDISRHMFDKWHRSASRGKFFHNEIKGFYDITRVG